MKLSLNMGNITCCYDFEKSLTMARDAGFEAGDYSLMDLVEDDQPFLGENYRALAEAERAICDKVGIPVTQTHAPFTFAAKLWDDPNTYRDVVLPRMIRSLEVSGILGAEVCVVHPVHHMVYHGHEEEIFERNMDFYRTLIPYAKEYGVKIGVENMFQHDKLRGHIIADTCSTSKEFIRYIDTLDSPQITACLDVGHVALPMSDETAADVIRALGHDRLGALHIHDNDFKRDRHDLPYLGKLDWPAITKALGEIDYQGDFTYEVNGVFLFDREESFHPVGLKIMADVGHYLVDQVEKNRPAK